MVDDGYLKAGVAPSYYLEGLLYNVPNENFGGSYCHPFVNALNWILHDAKKEDLICANEQYYLLQDNSPVCWSPANAERFLAATVNYWKTGHDRLQLLHCSARAQQQLMR